MNKIRPKNLYFAKILVMLMFLSLILLSRTESYSSSYGLFIPILLAMYFVFNRSVSLNEELFIFNDGYRKYTIKYDELSKIEYNKSSKKANKFTFYYKDNKKRMFMLAYMSDSQLKDIIDNIESNSSAIKLVTN